jgi:hypothetical protein
MEREGRDRLLQSEAVEVSEAATPPACRVFGCSTLRWPLFLWQEEKRGEAPEVLEGARVVNSVQVLTAQGAATVEGLVLPTRLPDGVYALVARDVSKERFTDGDVRAFEEELSLFGGLGEANAYIGVLAPK